MSVNGPEAPATRTPPGAQDAGPSATDRDGAAGTPTPTPSRVEPDALSVLTAVVRHHRRAERARWQALVDEEGGVAAIEEGPALALRPSAVIVTGGASTARRIVALTHHLQDDAAGPFVEARDLARAGAEAPALVRGAGTVYLDAAEGGADTTAWTVWARTAHGAGATVIVGGDDGDEAEGLWAATGLGGAVRRVRVAEAQAAVAGPTLRELVERHERGLIAEVLRAHGGNKTRAAEALGITREGLHKKLGKHRLT